MRTFRFLVFGAILVLFVSPLDFAYSAPSSTFTVTSVLDTVDAGPGDGVCADSVGACTLRAAVMEANALAGPDTILLPADTFSLTRARDSQNDDTSGDLDLRSQLTIMGVSENETIINGTFQLDDRIFQIHSGADVKISRLMIQNGNVGSGRDGGGIYNSGILSFSEGSIRSNAADDDGGGISNNGDLTLADCEISQNRALKEAGGGIDNNGTVEMTDCVVSENRAVFTGGVLNWDTFVMTDSIIVANESTAEFDTGSGVGNVHGTFTINSSQIISNTTNGNGAGVSQEIGGTLIIEDSTISGNSAELNGGGIYVDDGDVTVSNSTIAKNTSSANGGGIMILPRDSNSAISVDIDNSTISGNQANGLGGGIYVGEASTLNARNATIVSNTANADGGGVFTYGGGINNAGGTVSLFNTILGLNIHVIENQFGQIAVNDDCKGALSRLSYSLLATTTGCTYSSDTSIIEENPKLEALADNGGPTQTRALMADSPAIDAGDPNGCKDAEGNILTSDQRGEVRSFDGDLDGEVVCDIGAYEYVIYQQLTVNKDGSGDGSITSSPAGIDCGEDCSADLPQGSVVTLTAEADEGSSFTGWSGACSGMGDCQVIVDADKTITATFETNQQLTVTKDGTGTGRVTSSPAGVDCGTDCSTAFLQDSIVTLIAMADEGSSFSGWGGACSGIGDCQVTMDADKTVTATFEAEFKLFQPLLLR